MPQTLEAPIAVQDAPRSTDTDPQGALLELSDLELALVGGGIGVVSWG